MVDAALPRFVSRVLIVVAGAVLAASCSVGSRDSDRASNAGTSSIMSLVESEPRLGLVLERMADRPWPLAVPALESSPVRLLRLALAALANGQVDEARSIAEELLPMLTEREGALYASTSAPFRATSGEVILAPWTSSLSQGLALVLFDQLALAADDVELAGVATQLAEAYLVGTDDGGFTYYRDDGAVFAEYPSPSGAIDFDGGVTALLALLDYSGLEDNAELRSLAASSLSWWENNIDEFGVAGQAFDRTIEAPLFALRAAPARVLFRIIGDASVDVSTISIGGLGNAPIVAQIGDADDGEPGQAIRLMIDTDHHNWGSARYGTNSPVRRVQPRLGSDDHAPFVFDPSWSLLDRQLRIQIRAAVVGPGDAELEVFDGATYRRLAKLNGSPGMQTTMVTLDVSDLTPTQTDLIDSARFDRIVTLTGLLAEKTSSQPIRAAYERWKESTVLVPGMYQRADLDPMEADLGLDPVLTIEPGLDSVHVEYPGIVQSNGRLLMLYSAFGDDDRWRIRLADSSDQGYTWTRDGTVIDGAEFGYGAVAFPDILAMSEDDGYVVAFSADTDGEVGYDSVMVSVGSSIEALSTPEVAVAVGGLDPALWRDGDELHMSFTLVGESRTTIEHYVSADGRDWTRRSPLYSGDLSIYTQNTFILDETRVWIMNINQQRRSAVLFCRSSDTNELTAISNSEIAATDEREAIWNQYRYGHEVVLLESELVVFYNGIRRDLGDGNGMIGRSGLDLGDIEIPAACSTD